VAKRKQTWQRAARKRKALREKKARERLEKAADAVTEPPPAKPADEAQG
jgi:hypothetical protein